MSTPCPPSPTQVWDDFSRLQEWVSEAMKQYGHEPDPEEAGVIFCSWAERSGCVTDEGLSLYALSAKIDGYMLAAFEHAGRPVSRPGLIRALGGKIVREHYTEAGEAVPV